MLTALAKVAPALSLVLLAACHAWYRTSDGLRPDLAPRERREIWVRDRKAVVRAIELWGDTLRAIPDGKPVECECCAVVWLVSGVDSVRVRRIDAGKTLRAGGIWILIGGALYLLRQLGEDQQR